jgi:sec-independent protein translocase protein TatA
VFSDIGIQEILLILVIALVVVGPKKLPEMARSIGKGLREFRRASSEVRESLDLGLSDLDESTPPGPAAPPKPEANAGTGSGANGSETDQAG